jgi:hypothetical protein
MCHISNSDLALAVAFFEGFYLKFIIFKIFIHWPHLVAPEQTPMLILSLHICVSVGLRAVLQVKVKKGKYQ